MTDALEKLIADEKGNMRSCKELCGKLMNEETLWSDQVFVR